MSFNKIIIVGNLGKDPELRYTPNGVAVCSFSVATNEKRRDKSGEQQDITTWFRVTLWRERAETAAKYLTKGNPVYIEGKLRIEEYTDRDNNNRYSLEVQATDMQFIGSRSDAAAGGYTGHHDDEPAYTGAAPPAASSAASGAASSATSAPASSPAPTDDDIPF